MEARDLYILLIELGHLHTLKSTNLQKWKKTDDYDRDLRT